MEKANLNESNLLIDFSSSPVPVKKNVLRSPLIPIPANTAVNRLSSSPTNNPFDIVAKQSALTPDPFEIVLTNAQKPEKDSSTPTSDSSKCPGSPYSSNGIVFKINKSVSSVKPNKTEDSVQNNCTNSALIVTNEQRDCNKVESEYLCDEAVFNTAQESVTVAEADSQSLNFGDISSDEDLKAAIARRINTVVTRALSDSRPTSPTNNEPKVTYMNRRSQSFITEAKKNDKAEKLNKSFSFSQCPKFGGDLENMRSPDSSILFLDNSIPLNEMNSSNNDSVFLPADNELVFKEANKLARTFSKIAESFCHDTGSDNDEDLLSCKPRWLYADSSEDEEEKLRNDPALNVRVSLTPVMPSRRSEPAANKLSAFLKKARRSLDLIHNKSSQEETNAKRSEADGEKKPVTSELLVPPVVPSVPVVSVPDPAALRLKKRGAVETGKKGPMRAMMPVQSMTREAALIKGQPRKPSQDASPPRKQNSLLAMDTPKANSSKLGMRPVASSTPNKPVGLIPSPLAVVPGATGKNKRRSLESSLLNMQAHKSRMSEAEGARQRSNSATKISSLPVPASKGFRPTTVKSTSDPGRNTSAAQVNTQASKCKSSNTNVKPLNDAKPKSLLKGGIRSTVNAGFNNLAGKITGRKMSSQDKENRVPS